MLACGKLNGVRLVDFVLGLTLTSYNDHQQALFVVDYNMPASLFSPFWIIALASLAAESEGLLSAALNKFIANRPMPPTFRLSTIPNPATPETRRSAQCLRAVQYGPAESAPQIVS